MGFVGWSVCPPAFAGAGSRPLGPFGPLLRLSVSSVYPFVRWVRLVRLAVGPFVGLVRLSVASLTVGSTGTIYLTSGLDFSPRRLSQTEVCATSLSALSPAYAGAGSRPFDGWSVLETRPIFHQRDGIIGSSL